MASEALKWEEAKVGDVVPFPGKGEGPLASAEVLARLVSLKGARRVYDLFLFGVPVGQAESIKEGEFVVWREIP